ncbi:acyltransferase family protein [Clostridium butyricum]|uniref:Acyltransferase family protein n=1 Tax=Clostridium butyricum TaxID=1492 RepID=A0A6N3BLE7_CLOBU
MKREIYEKEYMKNLNYLKYIALMLVIIGHSTNVYRENWVFQSDIHSNFFKWISIYVNSFHMQIFIFISGSVYCYCKKYKYAYNNFKILILNKFKRLMIPYIIIGALYVIPIGIIIGIQTYQDGYQSSLINLLLGYESGHLWFLMMSFILLVVFFQLEKFFIEKNKCIIICLFFFVFQLLYSKLPRIFLINKAMFYMIFFYSGYILFLKYELISKIQFKLNSGKIIIISFLGINTLLAAKEIIPSIPIISSIIDIFISDIIGMLGVIQMYSVVLYFKKIRLNPKIKYTIKYINKYNFQIYLLHEPIIFIILYRFINYHSFFLVSICFMGSIIISIILINLYYLIKSKIQTIALLFLYPKL